MEDFRTLTEDTNDRLPLEEAKDDKKLKKTAKKLEKNISWLINDFLEDSDGMDLEAEVAGQVKDFLKMNNIK